MPKQFSVDAGLDAVWAVDVELDAKPGVTLPTGDCDEVARDRVPVWGHLHRLVRTTCATADHAVSMGIEVDADGVKV